jgi:hypothetical protein
MIFIRFYYLRRKDIAMDIQSELMNTSEASKLWDITPRQVQVLCEKGKVNGAFRLGRAWIIPRNAKKPIDGRTKAAKQIMTEAINNE